MITPNIDALAARGTVFERAYCQVATCRASREATLSGLRPDTTGVHLNGGAGFRKRWPDHRTLPQLFKDNGYHSQSLGKIFHGCFFVRSQWNDKASWSVPAWWAGPRYYYTEQGVDVARRVFAKGRDGKGKAIEEWQNHFVLGLSHEAPEVDDSTLYDGQIADRAVTTLRELNAKQKEQPFFLAVGFLRPHLPFVAPKKYWDMYPADEVKVADNLHPPADAPREGQTRWGHPRTYTDVPNSGPMPDHLTATLTRGYAACVTYVDAQVGRVLDELYELGLSENTIVVFWGDHGFHLGENDVWGKASNFELSTRAPLIVSAPNQKARGGKSSALVELIDVYPTVAELAGLEPPDVLEGRSLVPLLDDPQIKWKTEAFSQFPMHGAMGRSMRTDRYRFTRWTKGSSTVATALYDHETDPGENENIAGRPEYAELVKQMNARLDARWPKPVQPTGK